MSEHYTGGTQAKARRMTGQQRHPVALTLTLTRTNAQINAFNSQWHCPGAAGVDAFAQNDWRMHRNWCNPPWQLLDKLARHLSSTGAAATVVTPAWDHTAWFALLNRMSTRLQTGAP